MRVPNENKSPAAEMLHRWLGHCVEDGASDLHLIAGYPPVFRLHGELVELAEPPLTPDQIHQALSIFCEPQVFQRLADERNIDLSFDALVGQELCRFRANIFQASGEIGACLRLVPGTIPDFQWAEFPLDLAQRLAFLRDGLVIVTGATGTGKTTTLAMLVNLINRAGGYRIITVEEPVEYIFPREPNSVVSQREVGADVLTFADGLKYGLRQDPDVILVGEIRDHATAQMALSAAETGHLVFTTLHTRDCKGAISRFADLFPQEAQRDVRNVLAMSLRAVVSQRLLPSAEKGAKRHLALEVLWNTHPIASSVRLGKLENIDNYLLTCREEGMLSFDESVRVLLRAGKITRAVAEQNVNNVALLTR